MSSIWQFVCIALLIAICYGQSEDPFAEFDTEDTVIISEDYDIEIETQAEVSEDSSELEDDNSDQVIIEDEDFEGINPGSEKAHHGSNELNIVNAPINIRGHWDDYYLEIIGLIGVFVYALNFYTGKSINNRLANAWFEHHKKLLSDSFYIVGDDGVSKEVSEGVMVKESENKFVIWCTGRLGCDGIKIEIKLLRRQDLISVLSQIFKPNSDTITVTVYHGADDMDSIVLAVMPRKGIKRLQQEVQDLAHFATEKKVDKFDLPSQLGVLSEFSEVSNEFLSVPVCKTISENIDVFDSIHFSDYYTGFKISQESQAETERPKPVKRMIFNFVIPGYGKRTKSSIMETTEPLMRMVVHMMSKVTKFKLSRENKHKAEKHRIQVEEDFLKQTHSQRQEAAQARRDERKKLEKEKVQELDAEAQRRYEEREYKKNMRRSGPRVKQLKVKTG